MISNYDLSDFYWTPELCPECSQSDGSGELLEITTNSLHIWVCCRIWFLIPILFLGYFGISAQEEQGLTPVCGDSYHFEADDPQNWLIINQETEEQFTPQSDMELTGSEGFIVWHEFNYHFVYGYDECEEVNQTVNNQILENAVMFVKSKQIDLGEMIGG